MDAVHRRAPKVLDQAVWGRLPRLTGSRQCLLNKNAPAPRAGTTQLSRRQSRFWSGPDITLLRSAPLLGAVELLGSAMLAYSAEKLGDATDHGARCDEVEPRCPRQRPSEQRDGDPCQADQRPEDHVAHANLSQG